MAHVIYEFEIPDPVRPIAGERALGPSGELMPFVPALLRPELEVLFSNGDVLRIEEAHEGRPILEGSKEPRAFAAEDDLRRAVFLAPTAELWV